MLKKVLGAVGRLGARLRLPPLWAAALVLGVLAGAALQHYLLEPVLDGQRGQRLQDLQQDYALLKIENDRCLAARDRLAADLDACRQALGG